MSERGSNQGDGSLCNLEYLLVNLGRNQAMAERLIRLFLETYPGLCQRLLEAAGIGDRSVLKDTLHDIRSSCVLFSAHQCVELARDFEQALRDETPQAGNGEWISMATSLCTLIQCMAMELNAHLAQET